MSTRTKALNDKVSTIMRKRDRLRVVFVTLSVFTGMVLMLPGQAAKLSDLIRKSPQLYLPSQIIVGKPAMFTVKGKSGGEVQLILSSQPSGSDLPYGVQLRVGKATSETRGTIPTSGVLELEVTLPEEAATPGEKQFVEALVWPQDLQQTDIVEVADIIDSSGVVAAENSVLVVSEPSARRMMIAPGDPGVSNILRSVTTMSDIGDDPRKQQLIDDGNINRKRLIDQTLTTSPNP